jgi:hypothetical protein
MTAQMPERSLGKGGLIVSAIGLCCLRMNFGDKPIGETQVLKGKENKLAYGSPYEFSGRM